MINHKILYGTTRKMREMAFEYLAKIRAEGADLKNVLLDLNGPEPDGLEHDQGLRFTPNG